MEFMRCKFFLPMFVAFIFLAGMFFTSCQFESREAQIIEETEKSWTFVVYMAADNELEEFSLLDIKEMERAKVSNSAINLLVLIDRAEGNFQSNEDWTDTRLYKIADDDSSYGTELVSTRISCEDIGLYSDSNNELNMSSVQTLSGVIKFAIREYPTDHLGIILWGHGAENAFLSDESSSAYMTLPLLREGLESGLQGKRADFLALDTCFGSELEVLYELRDCATYFAGSPSLVKDSGWNYTTFFSSLASDDSCLAGDFCVKNVAILSQTQFINAYANISNLAFSVVDLTAIDLVFTAFDELSSATANLITDRNTRDSVFNLLFLQTKSYSADTKSCAKFLSLSDYAEKIASYNSSLREKSLALTAALENAVLSSTIENSPAVFFCKLTDSGSCSSVLPDDYRKKNTGGILEQMQFVNESTGYVSNKSTSNSLLDKLFYTNF